MSKYPSKVKTRGGGGGLVTEEDLPERLWILDGFEGITGTLLCLLDNYRFRPTSEGQITSAWGKKIKAQEKRECGTTESDA